MEIDHRIAEILTKLPYPDEPIGAKKANAVITSEMTDTFLVGISLDTFVNDAVSESPI
jgi:hypothetical protein